MWPVIVQVARLVDPIKQFLALELALSISGGLLLFTVWDRWSTPPWTWLKLDSPSDPPPGGNGEPSETVPEPRQDPSGDEDAVQEEPEAEKELALA